MRCGAWVAMGGARRIACRRARGKRVDDPCKLFPVTNAWIVDPRRSAFTRAGKGAFAAKRPDDLLTDLFAALLAAHPGAAEALEDIVVGCAYPEAEQGRNPARAAALLAGIPGRVPAMTLTRMCASSLEATAGSAGK